MGRKDRRERRQQRQQRPVRTGPGATEQLAEALRLAHRPSVWPAYRNWRLDLILRNQGGPYPSAVATRYWAEILDTEPADPPVRLVRYPRALTSGPSLVLQAVAFGTNFAASRRLLARHGLRADWPNVYRCHSGRRLVVEVPVYSVPRPTQQHLCQQNNDQCS